MDVENILKPYLEKGEKVDETLILKKCECFFTNKRLFVSFRKPFGLTKYLTEISFDEIGSAECYRKFNYMLFIFGLLFIFMAIHANFTQEYYSIYNYGLVLLGIITFLIVFFAPIRGIRIKHHLGGDPLEILGAKKDMEQVIPLLKERGILIEGKF